ncbi:hypothetical protein BGZ95_003950, partial [Linnemannia exigua]
HRQSAVLAPDLVVAGDFFNNFTDFETRRVSMGVSIRMDRVLEEQPLRFVCKSRQGRRRRPNKLRNRNGGNKHEGAGSTLSGGTRDEGGEMDIVVGENNGDVDDVDGGSDYGEGDELQGQSEEMEEDDEDEEREIVFFVVELRWDQPRSVVL